MRRKRISQAELDAIVKKNEWVISNGKPIPMGDLVGVDLRGMNLSRACLEGMDLSYSLLCGTNLSGANLTRCRMEKTDLRGANLYCAALRFADLRDAEVGGANFYMADFRRAKNVPEIPMACPESGSFIAYKKAYDLSGRPVIVELEIPKTARRSSATTEKCRCDIANVLKIYDFKMREIKGVVAYSEFDQYFEYSPGSPVSVDNFDDDRWNECSAGIHFFMNFQKAVEY